MIIAIVLKHHPRAREGRRGGSKGDASRDVTARGAMEKSWRVGVIERKKAREDDQLECSSLRASEVPFELYKG